MSKLQTLARKRNWNKARLVGFSVDKEGLTSSELATINSIKRQISVLIQHWSSGTKELGLKPKK